MRKLKNWYVEMKSIKGKNNNNINGVLNLYNYIYDTQNSHPNHQKKDHKVIGFEQKHNTIVKNFLSLQQRMDNIHSLKSGKKRCGRKSSYGSSILLSFPKELNLKVEDYKKIRDLILIKLIEFLSKEYSLDYTKQDRDKYITNYILSSLHLDNSPHINIMVPNVMIDYKNQNNLTRVNLGKKKVSYFLKNSLNGILLNRFSKNHLDYQIKSHKETKKTNTMYSHKLKEVESKKEDLKSQIENLSNLFTDTNETIQKIQKRVSVYSNRMETSIKEQDNDKFEKNKKLILQNIEKMKKEFENKTQKKETSFDMNEFEKLKSNFENKTYNNHIDLKR